MIHTQTIDYRDGDTVFQAYLAYAHENSEKQKRPLVLVAHAWRGRDDFVEEKARHLAKIGYVGFAMDVYGKGVLGDEPETNRKLMQPLMEDRKMLLRRLTKGLKTAKQVKVVDRTKIAAMGYCFGGLCVLDLARSGADLKGVVSFHGLLQAPKEILTKKIKSKILVLHGHEDPMVPPNIVFEFEKEMTDAKVDWQLHIFGRTMHAFTNPEANDFNMGTVYNSQAEKRSWFEATQFFKEIFQ
ncbi:MAG: dienelactone hydrolase family protein [Coxiella endosymbiont of Dermacentor nuttalli]